MVPRNIRKVTLALVGRGIWGSNYIKTISSLKACILPEKYVVTRNYEELVKYKDIDGIIIATPPSTHFKIAKYFISNEFNVLIEKPLALSSREAFTLERLQLKRNTIGMVGHIYEYHPAFQILKEKVNKWKDIRYIISEGMNWGPVRHDTSALWDWAPHDIGMILTLTKEMPQSVVCWSFAGRKKKTDTELCAFRCIFPSGITTLSKIGWLFPIKKRTLTVKSKSKAIIFDDTGKQKLSSFSLLNNKWVVDNIICKSKPPLTIEIEEFVNCILRRKNSVTDLLYGAKVIKVIELLEKSLFLDSKVVTVR